MRTIGRYNIMERHTLKDKQDIALLYNRYTDTWWIALGITDECKRDSNGVLVPVTTYGMISYNNKHEAYKKWDLVQKRA